MAFGKGTWIKQDKILPGTYINFEGEKQIADAFGVRGKAAMAVKLDWAVDDFIVLTPKVFRAKSKQLLGYDYNDPKLKPIYEVFLGGAREVYLYRLDGVGAKAATSTIADARGKGIRGNDLSILVEATIGGGEGEFDVTTLLKGVSVDKQFGVTAATVQDNEFVIFKNEPALSADTFTFTTGANGSQASAATHTAFLTKLESYPINCVGLVEPTTSDGDITKLYANWAIEQRDVYANTVQAVLYNSPSNHEAVINVDDSIDMVAWVLGAEAGCAIDETIQNKIYNGTVVPAKSYTQLELETAIQTGKLVFQQIGSEYRVLADINSLTTVSVDKNAEFKYNQTIRVMDQIANDVSNIFNNGYIGKVANNEAGRYSFKNQVIVLLNSYVDRSVLAPYETSEVTCVEGEQRGALVLSMPVKLVDMLEKAYITVVVG